MKTEVNVSKPKRLKWKVTDREGDEEKRNVDTLTDLTTHQLS